MFALPRLKVCFCLMPVEQDHGAVVGEGRFSLGGKMPEDQTVRGHRIERQEIGAPDDFAAIEAMSRVELEAYILAGVGELLIERQLVIEAKPLEEPQSDSD